MCTIKKNNGFTLIEVLIAVLLSGIIISGGFNFYTTMQNQTSIQMEISNIQNIARSSLDDIATTIRKAGYKLNTHDAFEINGDSLMVFFAQYNSVDTVIYFLSSDSDDDDNDDDDDDDDESSDNSSYYLMKYCSYGTTSIYSDNIVSIDFLDIDNNIIEITITAQSEYPDDTYELYNGYRRWTLSETVCIRNI